MRKDIYGRLMTLQKNELELKKAWMTGGKALLDSCMTYSEYVSNIEQGICIETDMSYYYKDYSVRKLGTTVIDVDDIAAGSNIYMTVHPRYSYPVLHNHSYIEIIYVYSGECKQFVEGKEFMLKRGDFCILAPDTMHAISVYDDDAIVMNFMVSNQMLNQGFLDLLRGGAVTVKFFEDLLYRRNLVSPYLIYPTGDNEDIRGLAEGIYVEIQEKQYAYEKNIQWMMQSLFIHLIRHYEMCAIVTTPSEAAFNEHIVPVLGYLSANYNRVSLKDTADFFGYTPNYLGKMLKKYTGKNYTELIDDYQMDSAKKMLVEGKTSLTEISQTIGCFDSSHFTKKFKKKFGISPTEYRIANEIKQEEQEN